MLTIIGAGLLGVAPSSQHRNYVLFVRGELKPPSTFGARESKTKLEERSEFKLQKERPAKSAEAKRPAAPFGVGEPDRMINQLYKVERSSPTRWEKLCV